MGKAYTILWGAKEIRNAHEDGVLTVLGSNWFGRRDLGDGDTVWVVTSPAKGRLHTLGAMRVAQPMSRAKAVKRHGDDLFGADWFVEAQDGQSIPVREVDVTGIAGRLRFVPSRGKKDHLDVSKNARSLGWQMRSMRLLRPESAALLARTYRATPDVRRQVRAAFESASASLAAGDVKREVLQRKEQGALRKLLFADRGAARCVICKDEFPVALLVAAHLKQRAQCSTAERNDPANIAPMCAFGCDALYERGQIVVSEGRIRLRVPPRGSGRLATLLRSLDGKRLSGLWRRSKKYLQWHARQPRTPE